MKNKKLPVIFCIFMFVVLVIILGSTVFTLQRMDLFFLNENGEFIEPGVEIGSLELDKDLTDIKGANIVFLSKEKVKELIESKNTYVKVEKIEKVFPDKIKVFASIRIPLYSIKIGNDIYALSHDGFVMSKNPDEQLNLVTVDGVSEGITAVEVGKYIKANFTDTNAYEKIENFFLSVWRQESFDYQSIHFLIKSISLSEGKLNVFTQRGAEFILLRPENDLFEKFTSIYGVYLKVPERQQKGIFTSGIKNDDGSYSVSVFPEIK